MRPREPYAKYILPYGLITVLLSTEDIDGIQGKNMTMAVDHFKTSIEFLFKSVMDSIYQSGM